MINNMENGSECAIAQDLLPLYHDGVCSEKSRLFVEKHLEACASCREMLQAIDENEAEAKFAEEAHNVLKRHAHKERTAAMKAGFIIAGILMIPVMIVIILTLPGYSSWKTAAVLIASMLLVAGMTVVPLISQKKRFSKAVISSTAALLLVIFFAEMLFDDGGLLRFGEIAFSTVFGISLVLAPSVIRQTDLPEPLKNQKGLLTMVWDTIWFYLMIFTFSIAYPVSIGNLLFVSTFFAALVWLIFLVGRYWRANGWIKAGMMIALTGIWTSIGNNVGWITIYDKDLHKEILTISLIAALILIILGAIRTLAAKRKQQ